MPVIRRGAPISVIQGRLAKLKNGQARAVLLKNLAAEAREQVMKSFRESRDPYGSQWKRVLRGGKPLLDTGRLRNSIRGEVLERGFRIATNVIYAAVHQYGAVIRAKNAPYLVFRIGRGKNARWASKEEVKIPQRAFVPTGRLGPIWEQAFVRVAHRVLKELLGGSRGQ